MKKQIDIILPILNEEKNISILYKSIKSIFSELPNYQPFFIFVDDGSTDKSWAEIKKISQKEKQLKAIRFSRNFGHQNAIESGINNANGVALIIMDADLQHPVNLIPKMIKKWEEDFKIVNTIRTKTHKISPIKKIFSNIFYKTFNFFSEIKIKSGSSDFRLLDKKVFEILQRFPEKNKFYRGLSLWVGFEKAEISFTASDRKFGNSEYSFKKMLNLGLIGITSSSLLPLKIIMILGILIFTLGTGLLFIISYCKYILGYKLFTGTAILATFIIANNGFLICVIGVLGLYILNIHNQIQNRPNYIISESIN